MTRPLAILLALLLSASALSVDSRTYHHPQGKQMGFPFQLRRGMTLTEVEGLVDSHFARKEGMNVTDTRYKNFTLREPKDSLFFGGVGPVVKMSYVLFKDTLSEVSLDFPEGGSVKIDTAGFIRSYSYEEGLRLNFELTLRDSSFAMVICPRKDHPSIDFFDIEVSRRKDQYRHAVAKQLAEDSVVIVVTADSGTAALPEKVVRGEEMWFDCPWVLGETARIESLKVTIRFIGIGTRKSQVGKDLTPQNATLFFAVDHNGVKRNTAISAKSEQTSQCVGVADDLPYWLVCASGFRQLMGTYEIKVSINQYARL